MGMRELDKALSIIDEHSEDEDTFFVGPRPEELIVKAENILGVKFPPTFRRFVAELGAGNIAGQEFYGVTTDNFTKATIPNGIWFTLHARKNYGLPNDLLILASLDDGSYVALNVHKDEFQSEAEVVLWSPGEEEEILYDDYGSFLLERITDALEY